MPILLAILLGTLGWLLWTGKLKPQQLPPVVLGIAGILAASRGAWIPGAAFVGIALAWYRGLTWRLADLIPKRGVDQQINKARKILGVGPNDNEITIRARHRKLISETHPDKGGNAERASALNEARDLLLTQLAKRDNNSTK